MFVNVLVVTLFLGILIAGVVLAFRVLGEGRSDRAARRNGGFAPAGQVAAPPGARGDMGNDDLYHRLM